MRNRSPGESLPRRLIRLQRARRCRRRPPCPDIERRAFKCTPSPHRSTFGIPARFLAVPLVSCSSTCRYCPSSRIHRHQDTPVTTSTSPLTPPPDVTSTTNLLRCGLFFKLSNHRTQAHPSGTSYASRTTFLRPKYEPIRAGNRKRLTCSPSAAGLLPPPISTSTRPATNHFTSNTSPPSSQHSPQQKTTDGWRTIIPHSSPWTSQRRRRTWHASARATASRAETQVYPRRRPATRRPEREEEPDLETNRRLLSWSQLRYPAGAILYEA